MISQTAEYALRAVVLLGSQPDRPMTRGKGGHTGMALSEGVSRFQYMACVFRVPDNADIVVICSLLHVARIWGIFAIAIS